MVTIIGAGMAGLLAGNLLLRRKPTILESQSELPNNHSATLGFRTGAVGDATGIPFKQVLMIKGTLPWRNPIADCLSYSFKNTGIRRSDRSITEGLVTETRYIAPPDFIARLAEPLSGALEFGHTADFSGEGPYISTIPMPSLAAALNYPYQEDIKFRNIPGVNIRGRIKDCEAYVSLLVPDPSFRFTRITVTGNELIVEVPDVQLIENFVAVQLATEAMELLGMQYEDLSEVVVVYSAYQKILPVRETARRFFIHWATDKHNVFSLGRYATARPGLLLDSLIQDVRLIAGWMDAGRYDMVRQRWTFSL